MQGGKHLSQLGPHTCASWAIHQQQKNFYSNILFILQYEQACYIFLYHSL